MLFYKIRGGSSFEKIVFDDFLIKNIICNKNKIFKLNTYTKINWYWARFKIKWKQNHKAQDMKILERWKEFKDDARMQMVLQDKEILSLSKKLFGDLF